MSDQDNPRLQRKRQERNYKKVLRTWALTREGYRRVLYVISIEGGLYVVEQ